jgi:4-amino-4-deoxy-L-arabinose transferase-like glycosyltransferase
MRLARLDEPIGLDERLTWVHFVRQPWWTVLSDYFIPNNHVFHTLLAKASTELFGQSLWALRLPALAAGLLIVPATYVAVRLLYGPRPALIATAIVAMSEESIAYAVDARGYSIVTLAFLVLVVLAVQLQRERSARRWVGWVLVGSIGLWTIPVMLFPLGAVTAWMALSSVRARSYAALRELALATAGVGALTAALYAPVVAHSGLAALTRNEYVVPSSWRTFAAELTRNVGETLGAWSASMPPVVAWLLALAIVLALRARASSPPPPAAA